MERPAVGKWAGQKHEQFDRLCLEFAALENRTETLKAIFSGQFDRDFVPDGFTPP